MKPLEQMFESPQAVKLARAIIQRTPPTVVGDFIPNYGAVIVDKASEDAQSAESPPAALVQLANDLSMLYHLATEGYIRSRGSHDRAPLYSR